MFVCLYSVVTYWKNLLKLTHTHTHTYVCVCVRLRVCVCVCVFSRYILEKFVQKHTQTHKHAYVCLSTDNSKSFQTENNKFVFQFY